MVTKIQTFNDKVMVTGEALKLMILERLPQKILEQMHMVDLTGKTDQEIINIITRAGWTAEKWEAARKNLGLRASLKSYDKKHPKLERNQDKPEKSERKCFRDQTERKRIEKDRSECMPKRSYVQTEGIEPSEIERRKAAGECHSCAWPADRKGNHRVKDCLRPIKLDKGTATYPKAKVYQKIKVAGIQSDSREELELEEENSSEELESEDDSSDSDGSDSEELGEEESEGENFDEECVQQEEQEERNWWDSLSDSEKASHRKL